ncbi:hypothetical protein N7471_009026 [Penicillium samsonianum]|uniref:uncharacterized protein n=1 Tax=Penicillium samsonianum TaxID=1882272 RepID=UPI002546F240|nr:uncharacterized protein N7471_009026 [Penicillium samsonianum]KAJ6127809.1 hypothetical protein N7471_009026 [Penicillium samsonianum]
MKNGSIVKDSHAPIWMQTVEVYWVHNPEVVEYGETVLAIKKAKSRKTAVPGSKFLLLWDPRVFATVAQLRDNIRRSLNCQALGLDLQSVCVMYHCEDGNCDEQTDGFVQACATLRGVFEGSGNSNFVLEVRTDPFDTEDPMYSLYKDDSDPIDPVTYLEIYT